MTYTNGFRVGVVRGISYGLFGRADEFVPQARALGAGLIRAYVYWAQVEPEPGRYEWDSVDALLAQLTGDEEVWLTVCSSSPWATREKTNFLPPSPAADIGAYAEFVRRLVVRCAGRVRFWQCDNEPSNTALLWAGTAAEYERQLVAMHAAVKSADPAASVVLGGCGYDVLGSDEGSEQRRFFEYVTGAGRDAFDVFSVHLYGDPYRIPEYVAMARGFMAAHGYHRPVVAGEFGGPMLFEFPQAEAAVHATMARAFGEPAPGAQSTGELARRASEDTPERRAMAALYSRMRELPDRLQMLMDGCPPELDSTRHRIACRQLVVRTVIALANGVPRLAYWNLAPEIPGYHDPYQIMHLLVGKLPLLDYDGTELARRYPAADTFALTARQLAGGTSAEPVELPGGADTGAMAYRIERGQRAPLLVAWLRRDWFDGDGDGEPAVHVTVPAAVGPAVDAFGVRQEVTDRAVPVSVTPVFVPLRA